MSDIKIGKLYLDNIRKTHHEIINIVEEKGKPLSYLVTGLGKVTKDYIEKNLKPLQEINS